MDNNVFSQEEAAELILNAMGTRLKHYDLNGSKERILEAVRAVQINSYIAGSDAAHNALTGKEGA